MESVIQRVLIERERQNSKWGVQDHNTIEWIGILTEEVGEASKEAVDFHFANGLKDPYKVPPVEVQEKRLENLKTELIQVAAVAIQAVESIERQNKFVKPKPPTFPEDRITKYN